MGFKVCGGVYIKYYGVITHIQNMCYPKQVFVQTKIRQKKESVKV
jgi:hypothetical protein